MQTFLPYPDFTKSAKALDNKRLGKQLVEVQQIFKALHDPGYGWQNHPAVNMWRGCETALLEYGVACYTEWKMRHDKSLRSGKRQHQSGDFILWQWALRCANLPVFPDWLHGPIHASHRAALKAKDPEYYASFDEEARIELFWPV